MNDPINREIDAMTMPMPHQSDVKGVTLELATQMLRVLVGVASLDASLVRTESGRRRVIAAFYYTTRDADVDGTVYDICDRPPERFLADSAVHFEHAEELALSMFEDIYFGGGCGEEPCCGPSGLWHQTHKNYRGGAPIYMTYGEWQLRNAIKRLRS